MNTESNQLVAVNGSLSLQALTPSELLGQVALIQQTMSLAMKDKEHYGTIPGCGNKPTLLKAGAEKLAFLFRLAPAFEIIEKEMERGHREYRVTCTMQHIGSGAIIGQGVGSATTMEGKWRFRTGPQKITDRPVPRAYWDLKKEDPGKAQELIGKGNAAKKGEDGSWYIAEGGGEKVEHDNPADYYNTVLKMAKKRAQVDATLTCTAASDIFTQDIEDMPEVIPAVAVNRESPQRQELPLRESAPREEFSSPEGQLWENVTIADVEEKSGTTKAGKPWTLYTVVLGDGRKVSTFGQNAAEQAVDCIGGTASIRTKPGRKEGTFEFVGIVAEAAETKDAEGNYDF